MKSEREVIKLLDKLERNRIRDQCKLNSYTHTMYDERIKALRWVLGVNNG